MHYLDFCIAYHPVELQGMPSYTIGRTVSSRLSAREGVLHSPAVTVRIVYPCIVVFLYSFALP